MKRHYTTNKIKIMQITHDLNIGGLQRVVTDIATNLNRSKYDVLVCALRESGPLEKELVDNGIKVIRLPSKNKVDYFSFWKIYKIILKEKPDVIHTHNTQPFIEGTFAGTLARVPVIVHTDHARDFPDKKRYMFAEWLFSHFVDRIAAVSEDTKEKLLKYEKISPKKITVILNGINGEKYQINVDKEKKKEEIDIGEKHSPILGVGVRLTKQKGITYLIQAMKMLVKDFPNILLLICGDGNLQDDLHIQVIQLGLEKHIRFLGPRLDMPEILKLLDIYVLPSIWEGLPLVLLEAMAASLPVIATDVGGNRQMVFDGVNGKLIKVKDPKAIFQAVKTLMNDKELRNKMAKNSIQLFQNKFTINKMINQYENIYAGCLN